MLEKKEVLVHKKCSRDFTDRKRSLQCSDVTTSKPKKVRSSMKPFSWKKCCFLCSKDAERDDKHPNGKQIVNVTLIPFRNEILEHCRNRNHEWANNAENRISCSNYLVADEAVYDKECLTSLCSIGHLLWRINKLQSFEMLCTWLEVEADAELYTITERHKK